MKTLCLAVTLAWVCILLISCGGGDSTTPTDVPDTAASRTATNAPVTPVPTSLLQAVLADSHYYTNLTTSAKITLDPIADVGYDNVVDESNHAVYFKQSFRNGDSKQHVIKMKYQFTLDQIDYRDGRSGPTVTTSYEYVPTHSFEEGYGDIEYTLPPLSSKTEKVIWRGTADYYSNLRDVSSYILTIDGLPARDPRDSLSQISIAASPANPPLVEGRFVRSSFMQCVISITNNDDIPHALFGDMKTHATHEYLGDTVQDDKEFALFNSSSVDIPPHATLYSLDVGEEQPFDPANATPLQIDVDGLPEEVLTFRVSDVELRIADPGDDMAPEQTTKAHPDFSGCRYDK